MSATLVGAVRGAAGEVGCGVRRDRRRALHLLGERAGDREDCDDDADRQGAEQHEEEVGETHGAHAGRRLTKLSKRTLADR